MRKIIFFFVLLSVSSYSQKHQNTDFDTAIHTSEEYLKKLKSDSAYIFAVKAQDIAEKINDKKLIAISYVTVANALYKKGRKDEAYTFGKKAEQISKAKNDIETQLKSYLLLANIHYSKFEDDKAINYYQKIEVLASKNNIENQTVVKAILNTGFLFFRGYEDGTKKPFDQAEIYFKRAQDLALKINDQDQYFVISLYLGSQLVEKKQFTQAVELYDDALAYFKKTNNIKEQSQVYWAFASLYHFWGKKELAEKNYQENIEINSIPNNINGLARAHWSYAGYFLQINNDIKAIEEYEKAIELFRKEKTIDSGPYSASLYDIAEAYKRIGSYEKALTNFEVYLAYNDSLNAIQNKEVFTEIEAKYQTEKKEQEIKLLSTENQLAKKQKYFYIALAFLLLLIGLSLFFGYRNKLKTAQKLKELNELKAKFFANISHEFRTPLTLIKSPVQSLQKALTSEEELKQVALIDKNSNRMLELVDQLLALSKIDNGKLQLILKEGNIPSFLHSVVEPFEFQAKENNIHFNAIIEKSLENQNFDKDVVEKIVTNLLSNAFKYTPSNEKILFNSSFENGNLKVIVSNTGTNLKKEEVSKLFERFYQVNESEKGVGIGLALVKELVELYEGEITTNVKNETLEFIVLLPLSKIPTNVILVTKEIPIEIDNSIENDNDLPILLIADDNSEIRSVLKDIFKGQFHILEAENGEKALKIAKKEIPDCIISDIMMPKMNGLEFAKAIKSNELTSFIPVILLTAKTSEEAHLESLRSTADAFLTKPFNHEIVEASVNQLIVERKKLQERYSQELVLRPVDIVINSVDEKFLEKLQEVLNKELSNADFSSDEFANAVGMSRMQLHRKLKSLLGVSATEFLRTERLKTAADLLKKGDGNISEIAYSVGFNDVSYFSKCFKEMYHCTPSEYTEKQ